MATQAPTRRLKLPLLVGLTLTVAVMMLCPAIVASAQDDDQIARAFFYAAIVTATLAGFATIAAQSLPPFRGAASALMAALAAYIFLPVVLAVPFTEALRDTRFLNAYFEMLSSLTTTGASYYDPDRLAPSLHLWRGMVGWLGGLMTWVIALAILAPLELGGFEVSSEARIPGARVATTGQMRSVDPSERLGRAVRRLVPIYVGLTGVLWLCLVLTAADPLPAAVHAMSTISTSGISANGGEIGSIGAEAMILIFFVFALTRRSFLSGFGLAVLGRLARDRELRLALFAATLITSLMFLRHWIGALEVDELGNPDAAFTALWGNFFTALSFVTTTGFASGAWDSAQSWSGLPSSGLVLIGLCLMGGGVATTAGGIKLLRVYALYKHGQREIEKLVHPNSVASAGRLGRRIRREGAYIAWIFFMLFILSFAAITVVLAATGQSFDEALILSIAALTTTGPLATFAPVEAIDYIALTDLTKATLSVAMILGRMELLVLIALVNPSFWRA